MDLYNGFNGLRHRINWTYFTVLDGLAHPLYSRNFKLLSETQCLCYVKSEFFYHGKEVFVYSYEVLLDVNRNNAIYKHLKIEKNLRFCSLFQLLRIYILSLKIVL